MKPIDVKSDSFAEYNEESNEKVFKFKIGYYVRISKNKNFFAKGYTYYIYLVSKLESRSFCN